MIVWLASYPRSGNTLLRTILQHAFGSPSYSIYDDPYDIGANPGVAQLVGHRPMGMELEQFLKQNRGTKAPIFVKTHDTPDLANGDERTIYIVRDGRAASVSYLKYLRRVIGRPNVTLQDVISGQNVRFGHWSGHIESWQPAVRPHTLLLRFEDLLDDPQRAIGKIGSFVSLQPVAEWRNDFETIRKSDPRFFNAGSNDESIAQVERDAGELFWKLHGRTMTAMDYPRRKPQSKPSPPRRTVYWVGCGLTSIGMHCHAMAHAMRDATTRRRIDLVILAPKAGTARALVSLDAQPALTRSVYQTSPERLTETTAFQSDASGRRRDLQADLMRQLSRTVTSTDIVVLATPTAPELAALGDWYEQLDRPRRPRIAAYCVLPMAYRLAKDAGWQAEAVRRDYASALQRLTDLTAGRFRLFCENRQVFEDLSPFVPDARLQPHIFSRSEAIESRGRPGVPYVLMIGSVSPTRKDKGIDLVLEMLRSPAAQETDFDWIVQLAPLHRKRLPDFGKNTTFILDVPDHREYWNYLAGAALVLLPYDPVAYGDGRGSGIFEEARAAGVPVLCSEAPFFVEQLTHLDEPNLMFRPYTAQALLEKTIAVMTKIEPYRTRFRTRAAAVENRAGDLLQELLGESA